jgi:hypothetical protein
MTTSRLALALALIARIAHADDEPVKPADVPAAPDPAPAPDAAKPEEPKATPPAPAEEPKKVTVVVANGMLQRQGISPDFTISGGVRLYHNDTGDSRWWFGRVRAGVLIYQEPTFLSVGVAGQFGPLDSAALGIEARMFNLWNGGWVQGGVYPLDRAGGVSLEAALGYGIFGLDYERRVSGPHGGDQTLCITLEVPLGLLRVVLKDPEGVIHLPKSTTAVR